MKIRRKTSRPTPEEALRECRLALIQLKIEHDAALAAMAAVAQDDHPYTRPLVAWRAWMISDDGLLSSTVVADSIWEPRLILPAEHKKDRRYDHHPGCAAPVTDCDCGYYTVRHAHDLGRVFSRLQPDVWGKVSIWGKVIEHDYGYRSQYAYPKELFVNVDSAPALIAHHLAETYGVPCEPAAYVPAVRKRERPPAPTMPFYSFYSTGTNTVASTNTVSSQWHWLES